MDPDPANSQESSHLETIWTVHVEVRLSAKSKRRFDTIKSQVKGWLQSLECLSIPSDLHGWEQDPSLASCVERIAVAESPCPSSILPLSQISLNIHTYQPIESDSVDEYTNGNDSGEGEGVLAASVCELPSTSLEGLWDGLIYSDNIKLRLLDYIHATLILSDLNVDSNLVSWNRVVLLHGPPGTGKTSLCRALAQKLSIRMSHRYSQSRLLEINSHSLFSRWFSESGKLVQRLFNNINEMIEDEDCFVVVLIDEVESLTAARAGAMAGTEPSDGLRVVNALLTQLDKLRQKKNVLVMSTSNLAKAIDSAFVDRADIVQYVDLPPREAIYEILRSSICEFVDKKLIQEAVVPPLNEALFYEDTGNYAQQNDGSPVSTAPHTERVKLGRSLLTLSARCRELGLSGRALRRLPVLALARYIGLGVSSRNGILDNDSGNFHTDIYTWLDAMGKVLDERASTHGQLLQ
ncbi:AAA-domain-containing protein [Coniophora puteana RWD-64-598 SS2]|uniref:AAA-domain-containing protein n=1 Tax=Coniophora puteana (strain RWD-64-598) TaxID=741705 RepID=A0A5M3MU51_CONPW|nr:AAA-domain-containing protein [Coniophora puteana RWD-64-598 SS2]EIW82235.1 AAA-domain-containing protein [Coniophora puteana RWD-64-598 SS2]